MAPTQAYCLWSIHTNKHWKHLSSQSNYNNKDVTNHNHQKRQNSNKKFRFEDISTAGEPDHKKRKLQLQKALSAVASDQNDDSDQTWNAMWYILKQDAVALLIHLTLYDMVKLFANMLIFFLITVPTWILSLIPHQSKRNKRLYGIKDKQYQNRKTPLEMDWRLRFGSCPHHT